MRGSWRLNVGLGATGVVLVVLFSIVHNPWLVILERSLYAFVAFYIIGYLTRWLLALILPISGTAVSTQQDQAGTILDLVADDSEDQELSQLLKEQMQQDVATGSSTIPVIHESDAEEEAFQPLSPPQFKSAGNQQPEELAQAIRHLTRE